MPTEKKESHVDYDKLQTALKGLLEVLAPLNAEERRRVVSSVIIFHEIPIGKSVRDHQGQDDCG